jgi:bifunctional non-homologous end joining protein LigD
MNARAARRKDGPELVARFDFLEWTDSNHVRHIKFIAMRDDKDPRKVVREG